MKVVVTGGAGFIGANLCRRLIADPQIDSVTVLDDLSTGAFKNLEGLHLDFHPGSILSISDIENAFDQASAIVHLAARPSVPRSLENPRATHDANVTGTMNVLEGARIADNAHVIVASSSSVYGANPQMPKVETLVPMPMSPYAASKLATESYALAWQRSFGIPVTAFRFFNVYGPLQSAGHAYAAVIPAFIQNAILGEPLVIHGDGTQTRDFTFVETVCDAITKAITRKVSVDQPINLALGSRSSLLELANIVRDVTGKDVETVFAEPRTGDVKHSSADPSFLQSWFPDLEQRSLIEGVRATYKWMLGEATAR
jgi:UDP-glucose 4-epimerase